MADNKIYFDRDCGRRIRRHGNGRGTLTIPLLTMLGGLKQHIAQAINLASFIPMAVIALILHLKNKLVKTQGVLFIIIPLWF